MLKYEFVAMNSAVIARLLLRVKLLIERMLLSVARAGSIPGLTKESVEVEALYFRVLIPQKLR